jgi:hypothetical protein
VQNPERATARLAHGPIASRQTKTAQVSRAPPSTGRNDEELTTPHRPVQPVPGTVPRHAQHGRVHLVLGHAREDVGEVVLDGYHARTPGRRVTRGSVVRVRVADHDRRALVVHEREVVDNTFERPPCRFRFQVADMLAQEHLAALGQRHRVLEMRPDGDCGLTAAAAQRQRRVAPGPAQNLLPTAYHRHDGIVYGAYDRPVVHEKPVGDSREPLDRFDLVGTDGLVRHVSAGGDDGKSQRIEQQDVQRRIREHRSDARVTRRDARGDHCARVRTLLEKHDGRGRRAQRP